jgi:hypothetical protein
MYESQRVTLKVFDHDMFSNLQSALFSPYRINDDHITTTTRNMLAACQYLLGA